MNHTKKNYDILIEDYLHIIKSKCEMKKPIIKKSSKVFDDKLIIPSIDDYNGLIFNNYNVSQLKSFAKHYKLKISGNKTQLVNRIYTYLYLSHHIIKIQKVFRRFLVKIYTDLRGPGAKNRKICTNSDDFVSMEPIKEINFHQFISYKDVDAFVYGFDIKSLHNFLKTNNNNDVKNPYNRIIIPEYVFKNIKILLRISSILKIQIQLNLEDDIINLPQEKAIELKVISLFQNIDALGNYSNVNWFFSLNRTQLIIFLKELVDIWNYRAQLSQEMKQNIFPPTGNPFSYLNIEHLNVIENLYDMKKLILEIMDRFVNSGINKDSRSLGAYYVLGALTLVSHEAAAAMPWLFQSVNHY